MHDSSADGPWISSLRRQAFDVVGPLLGGAGQCALVGYPNHNNWGDSAIWLGELALLQALGVDIAYQCDDAAHHPVDLKRALPDGPILLHGGGNYGDLCPALQRFRERVLRDFPTRRIVQLPQTVTFTTAASLKSHRRLLRARQGPLSVLCRDRASHRLVAEEFTVEAHLCRDSAFLLEPQAPGLPVVDVVVNQRLDHESASTTPLAPEGWSYERLDWLPAPGAAGLRRATSAKARTLARRLATSSHRDARLSRLQRRAPMIGCRWLAQRRVDRAVDMLSRGSVVVTDRLHGHILCVLLGIPHVILDTTRRQIAGYHEAFTLDSRTTAVATNPAEVPDLVGALLAARWQDSAAEVDDA